MSVDERAQLTAAYEERVRTLEAGLRRLDRELRILSSVAARIHGEDSEQVILDIALEEILHHMELRAAWVFLGDTGNTKLQLAASRGVSSGYLEEVRTTGLGDCLCPEVFWSGHTMLARNTTQCPRMPTIVEGLSVPVSHACIPLRFEGERKGVLNVAARPEEQFSSDELRLLETLGHQISVAIERARHLRTARTAYEELKQAQARVIDNEKMAVVGTFASGLAHEVRNPLNSMSLQLVILERRLASLGEQGEMSRVTAIIREEIDRLNRLVDDFLMFSRTNRIHFQPASLDAVVDDVMHLLRPEARSQGVTLRRQQLGDPLPALRMDVEKMKQVVINLVKNAMEAMPEGGSVIVESGLREGRACLAVRDTGPGLPEGVDVFQIFTTTKAKGTGLGLSIAQQVVLEHGGEILARSAPGEGATLEISLPLGPEGSVRDEEGTR